MEQTAVAVSMDWSSLIINGGATATVSALLVWLIVKAFPNLIGQIKGMLDEFRTEAREQRKHNSEQVDKLSAAIKEQSSQFTATVQKLAGKSDK